VTCMADEEQLAILQQGVRPGQTDERRFMRSAG
jgi:hypothetical protein